MYWYINGFISNDVVWIPFLVPDENLKDDTVIRIKKTVKFNRYCNQTLCKKKKKKKKVIGLL